MPIDSINAALAQAVWLLTPEMILAGFACLIFIGGTFVANRNLWGLIALIGFGAAFLDALHSPSTGSVGELFVVPVVVDSLSQYTRYLALASGAVLLLLSWSEVADRQAADHHACLLILIAGVSLVGSANDLTTMFLALELISIPTYIMLYLPRADDKAQEAALKYFLLSIFSSGVLLFGFSYLFGITGSTNLSVILHTLNHNLLQADFPVASAIALVTIVCGLAFRITAVPFHFYAPDVYQGVANVNAALLAYIPKIAGIVALLRILGFVLPDSVIAPARTIGVALSDHHTPLLLWILSALTMSVGNLLALRQEHVRRIFAYSSIAHAGYMLAALSAAPYLRRTPDCPDGVEAVLYYLVAYGVTTVGAFAILAYLDSDNRRIDTLDDIAGLSIEHPGLAICLAIFIFSLVGIPLTAGFTGKFLIIFSTLALQEPHAVLYRVLALILVVNSAIGSWYYLRMVAALFLRNPLKPFPTQKSIPALATIAICMALTIGLSFPPGLTWMQHVVKAAAKNPSEVAVAERQ